LHDHDTCRPLLLVELMPASMCEPPEIMSFYPWTLCKTWILRTGHVFPFTLMFAFRRALDVCISTETGPQGLTEADTLQHTYLTGLLKV
jgi:hypothetical protein